MKENRTKGLHACQERMEKEWESGDVAKMALGGVFGFTLDNYASRVQMQMQMQMQGEKMREVEGGKEGGRVNRRYIQYPTVQVQLQLQLQLPTGCYYPRVPSNTNSAIAHSSLHGLFPIFSHENKGKGKSHLPKGDITQNISI